MAGSSPLNETPQDVGARWPRHPRSTRPRKTLARDGRAISARRDPAGRWRAMAAPSPLDETCEDAGARWPRHPRSTRPREDAGARWHSHDLRTSSSVPSSAEGTPIEPERPAGSRSTAMATPSAANVARARQAHRFVPVIVEEGRPRARTRARARPRRPLTSMRSRHRDSLPRSRSRVSSTCLGHLLVHVHAFRRRASFAFTSFVDAPRSRSRLHASSLGNPPVKPYKPFR